MLSTKKVLFMGTLPKEHTADGYSNASFGLLQILGTMMQQKIIRTVEAVDLTDIKTIKVPMEYFDTIIININPFSFNNKEVLEILKKVFARGKKVYLQIVWETDTFPIDWKWIWNSDMFSGFIAPSHFIEGMLKNITNKHIFYIPHFINTKLFSQIDVNKKINEEYFTVLSIGQWTKRKGNEDAIVAFARALGDKEDCKLIVKYTPMQNIDTEIEVHNLIVSNCKKLEASIYVNGDKIPFNELLELYKMSSILLYPSRGEGFSLPSAECCSVGIPMIYTDWSSTPEVSKAPGNIPVRYTLDEAVGMILFNYEICSQYAIPFMSDLVNILRYKYELWKQDKRKYYEETKDNYKIIEEKFGVKALLNYMINFLEKN